MPTFAVRTLAIALWSAASLAAQEPFALVGATVHPGDGSPAIADAVVVVRDGTIAAVGPRASTKVPDGVRTVDLAGQHVTPGLIDTHVHYSQTGWADGRPDAVNVREQFPYEQAMADNRAHPERFHRAFLHAGVTAVFDVGGYPWTLGLQAATAKDPLAPHVLATGPLLATFDPKLSLPDARQFDFPQDEAAARAMVQAHKKAGSGAIKFWFVTQADDEVAKWTPVLLAIGDEAKRAGLPLVVHATTLATAKVAVAAGARLLVHSVEDVAVDEPFVAACKQAGTFYCPTLTVYAGYAQLYAGKLSDEVKAQLDAVHPTVKERALRTEQLPRRNPRILEAMAKHLELQGDVVAQNVKALLAAGVPIVLGTDAGNPLTLHGPSVFAEMEAMAKAGMTPAQVLKAATHDAARAMGRSDLGRVAVGSVADLVVLGDDPSDVKAFRSPKFVVRAGVMHERAALLPK
ncbi:MAG: amidohydrolase family protein [Planctomycetes bacterium]|nr:amidohydrolase family protein [Planctomycetota bacterium]